MLGVTPDVLCGCRQDRATTEAREALILVGTERLRFRLSALAALLGKSPETASRWVSRGALSRLGDPAFAAKVQALATAIDL
ncbi:MAG TPA: hypothetical protein PLS53_12245 [Thermoanaerobaculaceae bacterium]|nr:hypothetical protein [Thermoanaerobaculaceae bacterium]